MSHNPEPFGDYTNRGQMRYEIRRQMVDGALIAAGVLFGPILFIYVIYAFGTLLPPESKEAEDPTPDSFSSYYEHVVTTQETA